jgi:DNA invertase Pin-like site-specific DNA recombinase/ACT domain-containing protein
MAIREEINFKKLRYVLYARKSSEDDSKQVRSIDDQVLDCRRLQKKLGLNVVEVITETKSAKKPGLRKEFDRMLKGIKANKYDAILCWNPNRLSRNMLESGIIIDMLDDYILKDIRFHSHEFTNNTNGKMMLGMLFVFSKEYSDSLSDSVNRGIQGNLREGKSGGTPKLGYTRNEVSSYYDRNEFYDAIEEAWRMRLNGSSVREITDYLIAQGVHRKTKNIRNQRILKPTHSTVANMFHDPFYYGILLQSRQTTDLREVTNFKPMIDKDTYDAVQALGYGRTKDTAPKKRTTFFPLRGMVYCAVCNSPKYMGPGAPRNGSGERVLTYRCDNKSCDRSPRSLRAFKVFDSIYAILESVQPNGEAYERYKRELEGMTDEMIIKIKQEVHSKKGMASHLTKEISDRTRTAGLINEKTTASRINNAKIEELSIELANLEFDIQKLEEKIVDPERIRLSRDEFLNLLKTAPDKMRAGSAVEKDRLCRILFLNVHVDNEKVANYLWREPFATMAKMGELQVGGGGWT